ncbi:demethylmenaquinone methyltransferase [Syntrophobotulus glycolicus DSM 8271]|uniref:Demethylmenaquinone methyltransferase n=1 Tax=Syntrophobotulus glycolicus (strain DSM 8271 / FlGlyR) TaxID=645991 RepID=F0T2R7_SYNGF|nr:demethylmenaquinone methyltransferase [Syntrophobotulus glycolicus]ADY56466.1 demethylmenaquinone methyltransferase [Syntrophobotulus glycolicus DSM 8271]
MEYGQKNKSQYVQDTFNSIASRYDLMNSLMSMGMDRSWRRKTVQTVKAGPGLNILDLCCGTGKMVMEIGKRVGPSGRVTGLDFSEQMLEKARENLLEYPYRDRVDLIQGDAMKLPFEQGTFDGVTVGWGLRNVPELRRVVREMARVIKSGSMVVSIDMGKPEMPVFKQVYWLLFRKLVPLMGKLWAGKAKEYEYLYSSACEFESQQQLAAIFCECGLTNTGYKNLMGGAVAIVYGQKP